VPLALIDPMSSAYTSESITISSALEAANHIAVNWPDNGLENHICNALDVSKVYKAWLNAMPTAKPTAIKTYQSNYSKRNDVAVNSEILKNGDTLDSGQILFHGGLWGGGNGAVVTSRPLSTTLNPSVAFSSALWQAKAYDDDRLDIIVLKMTNATTMAYVFNRKGDFSHEREVLLPAGITLTFVSENRLNPAYTVTKVDCPNKTIPVYVVEVEVS
jgi:hypothetical protein